MQYNKPILLNAKAVDYTHDGKGVVKQDGQLVFVENLLLHETADIQIDVDKKTFKLGSVVKRHTTSVDRITPPCPYFEFVLTL